MFKIKEREMMKMIEIENVYKLFIQGNSEQKVLKNN